MTDVPVPQNALSRCPQPADLYAAVQSIFGATDTLGVCQRTMLQVQTLTDAERMEVFLVDRSRKRVIFQFDNGRVVGLMETNYKAWNNSLGGTAFRTGQIILLNGAQNEQLLQAGIPAREDLMLLQEANEESQIVAPLTALGHKLGTMTISHPAERPLFGLDEVNTVKMLASVAAACLENIHLQQAEQDRRRIAENLLQAGRRLSGALRLADVPTHILSQLAMVVPFERGSLMLQENNLLRIVAQKGFPDDRRAQELRVSIREGDVYSQVAVGGRPVIIEDVTQITGWQQVSWLPLNRSWMGVPLFSQDYVIGMISLTRRDAGAFSVDDSLLASTFGLQAAIALKNAELYDELTRFNQQLEGMVQQRTEALEQALGTLERMDRHKSDFISVAAHELRTPLTVMKGYTSMLEADPAIRSQGHLLESIRGVLSGTERLHEVVNSMLDVARLENQVMKPHSEPVSLMAIVRRVCADIDAGVKARAITIEPQNLGALPRIVGDSSLLLKVFQNVIYNAVKFTPDGGKITISGQPVADEKLGDCIEVQVQDTGIGIDPAHHELIFEKFYQTGKVELHSSGKLTFCGGGPGLGLSIARGIVQAHEGRIWVESTGCDEKKCPGSTFHILLPVDRRQKSAEHA
ncbi:MAG: ATP-binding protein [Chloroflexota bacterium]